MEIEVGAAVDAILSMSSSVRVVTICDMKGKLIYSGRSKAVENKLSSSESLKSLEQSARNVKERKKLAKKIGVFRYTLSVYADVKRLVVPAGRSHLFFVTCSPRYDHAKIVRKIESFK